MADNSQPCTVTVSAVVNIDTEPGYDYGYITCEKSGGNTVDLWSDDGVAEALAVGGATFYTPGEYIGADADEVRVLFAHSYFHHTSPIPIHSPYYNSLHFLHIYPIVPYFTNPPTSQLSF